MIRNFMLFYPQKSFADMTVSTLHPNLACNSLNWFDSFGFDFSNDADDELGFILVFDSPNDLVSRSEN